MLTVFLLSLGLTVLAEEIISLAWGLRGGWELGLVALVNCLTNPPAVLFYGTAVSLWRWPSWPVTAVLELGVVLVEWRCYRAFSKKMRKPFLFSLAANGFSYGLGRLLPLLIL